MVSIETHSQPASDQIIIQWYHNDYNSKLMYTVKSHFIVVRLNSESHRIKLIVRMFLQGNFQTVLLQQITYVDKKHLFVIQQISYGDNRKVWLIWYIFS